MVSGRIVKTKDSKGYNSYRIHLPKMMVEEFFTTADETPVTIRFGENKIKLIKREGEVKQESGRIQDR